MQETINIRPGVAMLGILKHIEYDHWYAIAEFVDNAIDSYLKNVSALKEIEGEGYRLEVAIEVDTSESIIRIRDNAAGIDEQNYARAFRPAERPVDSSGLSEFGMGMKSAACWYSDYWAVRTTAIGEPVEKLVVFDMDKIFEDQLEELFVATEPTFPSKHYTVIELSRVHRMPQKKTIAKIKSHLASIYRDFTRSNTLRLLLNGEQLTYEEPKILQAPSYDNLTGPSVIWKHDVNFPIDDALSVQGFVALREKGSTSEAGLALFRRGRVIQGSFDETFRPPQIFKNPNSFRYQRIFGELHLNGFEVSFSKRGFQADENMQIFLDLLEEDLAPLLEQADHYRVKASETDYKNTSSVVVKNTVAQLEQSAQEILTTIRNLPALDPELNQSLSLTEKASNQLFQVEFNDSTWEILIEMSYDVSIRNFYEIGDHLIPQHLIGRQKDVRQVGIRLSLIHPFMEYYAGIDKSRLEPILKIIAALGLAETVAKSVHSTGQGEIRRNFNALVSNLLTK